MRVLDLVKCAICIIVFFVDIVGAFCAPEYAATFFFAAAMMLFALWAILYPQKP